MIEQIIDDFFITKLSEVFSIKVFFMPLIFQSKQWNELYLDTNNSYEKETILLEGNMLNLQSKDSNGVYGYRDERTIFVHGTFSDPKIAFSKEFTEATAKVLNDPHQEDFIWSGQNNKSAREEAAKELLNQIQKP